MAKSIALFGSTGSIGLSSLKIIRANPDAFRLVVLAAHSNVELLAAQALEFQPKYACIVDEAKFEQLKILLQGSKIEVIAGTAALHQISKLKVDLTIMAIMGSAAIIPTINAIEANNNIALANKECLVCAGNIIMSLAQKHQVRIIPMDSEHTGLYQIFDRKRPYLVKDVTLTASGGPFREYSLGQLKNITKAQALKHPNWSMGAKISIDSATLVNKCLEVIEACHLFALHASQVKILVHPESIIHALINYQDGSVLAQLSQTDMQIPISYALFYPERALLTEFNSFDLSKLGKLHFAPADKSRFKSLLLLDEVLKIITTNAALVFNIANEVAVEAFLNGQISFMQITDIISHILNQVPSRRLDNLEDILAEAALVQRKTTNYIKHIIA